MPKKRAGKGGRAVKLVDIARDAGVTSTVVSSFFNGNYYENRDGAVVGISQNTIQRIIKSCRKLGYRPVDPVRFMELYPEEGDVLFLLDKRHHTFSHGYFYKILKGLTLEAEQEDVSLVLGWFEEGVDYLQNPELVPSAVKKNPNGKYVLSGNPNYSLILHLIQNGARICYTSRHVEVPGVVSLVPDHLGAAKLAISHLIGAGHRKISVVADPRFDGAGYHTKEFIKGCTEAFEQVGQAFDGDDLIFFGPGSEKQDDVKAHFVGEDPPTAVFCFDDFTAMYLMQRGTEWGLGFPEDLSIIGCNDDDEVSRLAPGLTTIRFPMESIGKGAYRRIQKCATEGIPQRAELEVWPIELVERSSVRRLA